MGIGLYYRNTPMAGSVLTNEVVYLLKPSNGYKLSFFFFEKIKIATITYKMEVEMSDRLQSDDIFKYSYEYKKGLLIKKMFLKHKLFSQI